MFSIYFIRQSTARRRTSRGTSIIFHGFEYHPDWCKVCEKATAEQIWRSQFSPNPPLKVTAVPSLNTWVSNSFFPGSYYRRQLHFFCYREIQYYCAYYTCLSCLSACLSRCERFSALQRTQSTRTIVNAGLLCSPLLLEKKKMKLDLAAVLAWVQVLS